MKKVNTLFTLGSLLTLSACSFQGAGDKNSVQLKAASDPENSLMQGLGGKGRAPTTAPWSENASKRYETPESYQRAIDRALAHIKANQDSMLTNPDFSFSVQSVIMNEAGEETIRFESRFKGRRVIGGNVVVQSHSDGSVKKIEKNLQKEIKLSASGLISSEKARDVALGVFDGELHESKEPEAIIYAVGGEPKEAFEIILRGKNGVNELGVELQVLVDARSGEVLAKWNMICEAEQLASASSADNSNVTLGTPLMPLDQTFKLHSKPSASKVIYLDFDGHNTSGTNWNTSYNSGAMGASFYSPAFDTSGDPSVFTSDELTLIQNAWQRVAADFSAFDVDITTQEPPIDWLKKSDVTDVNYGIRVVITSFGPGSVDGVGGIAYADSFRSSADTPAFVYNSTMLALACTISHEVGHSLGLSHDGTTGEYYSGHGTGATSWAPIMGAAWSKNMSTWDNGIYYLSNNTGSMANYGKGADDIAVITGYNGFGYQTDLEGETKEQSTVLQLNGTVVSQFGAIQTKADQDVFRLDLQTESQIDLSFEPAIYRAFINTDGLWRGSVNTYTARVNDANTSTSYAEAATNLDLRIELIDASGTVLRSLGTNGRNALFSQILAAGTYYFRLDGQGYGDPTSSTPTGYTDYASVGNYLISGTVTASTTTTTTLPAITLAVSPNSVSEDGSSNLVFTFTRSVVTADPLTVSFTTSGSATSGVDYNGLVAGSSSSQTVTFAANAAIATVVIDPIADSSVESDETLSLTVLAGTGYTLGSSTTATGTILNDDIVPTPAITLSLSPSSISEDGSANLVFTFTRSVVTAEPLIVNFSVSGTAGNGSDYSGLLAGSAQTVTIAANAATATVVIDPTTDTTVESDETVILTLAAGAGYTISTSGAVTGTITNDDQASAIAQFTSGLDALTGLATSNTFKLLSLTDALWSSTPDRITNLNTATDIIDTPSTRTTAITAKALGSVQTLDAAGIGALLTNRRFNKNGAATFTFNSGTGVRTFLAINDGVSGFNAATDAVIEITGYTGSLSTLAVY